MKVPINLSSEPYENLRPLYFVTLLAAVLLITLALLVGWKARQNRSETRLLTEQTARLDTELTNMQREQHDLTQWLARPEVQEIRERSGFLNSLIVRKSLSWTEMFMDLEEILPDRVQVVGIQPSLTESAEAELKLTVASPNTAPLIELLKKLESAPQFATPVVDAQRFPAEKAADPNIVLQLSVLYKQAAASQSAPGQATESENQQAVEQPAGRPAASLADASAGRVPRGRR